MEFNRDFLFSEEAACRHAPTVLEISGGRFLAACFEGSAEGKEDVGIRISLPPEGSRRRSIRIKVSREPHWNPVLFRLPDTRIALYFKVGCPIARWRTFVAYSGDEGERWSLPVELVPGDGSGGRGPVKNKPLLLSSGRIAAPASVERERWSARVDLSSDGGLSWPETAEVPMPEERKEGAEPPLGVIQPTLWESAPGRVHMLLRSNRGRIYRSDSGDGGSSWSPVYPTALPNNNSGIDLVRTGNGVLLLVCNPCGRNQGSRSRLVLLSSRDNGASWRERCVLEDRSGSDPGAEFSYPAIITSSNGEAVIVYTFLRRNIALVRIPLTRLE